MCPRLASPAPAACERVHLAAGNLAAPASAPAPRWLTCRRAQEVAAPPAG